MKKKYYASLTFRISERSIERAYENTPYPNDDGTIDYYKENMGEFSAIGAYWVDSYEEAEEYFKRVSPTVWKEEDTRISLIHRKEDK